MQEQILDLLAQVDCLLERATCDGEPLSAEIEEHVLCSLRTLAQTVEYYID